MPKPGHGLHPTLQWDLPRTVTARQVPFQGKHFHHPAPAFGYSALPPFPIYPELATGLLSSLLDSRLPSLRFFGSGVLTALKVLLRAGHMGVLLPSVRSRCCLHVPISAVSIAPEPAATPAETASTAPEPSAVSRCHHVHVPSPTSALVRASAVYAMGRCFHAPRENVAPEDDSWEFALLKMAFNNLLSPTRMKRSTFITYLTTSSCQMPFLWPCHTSMTQLHTPQPW